MRHHVTLGDVDRDQSWVSAPSMGWYRSYNGRQLFCSWTKNEDRQLTPRVFFDYHLSRSLEMHDSNPWTEYSVLSTQYSVSTGQSTRQNLTDDSTWSERSAAAVEWTTCNQKLYSNSRWHLNLSAHRPGWFKTCIMHCDRVMRLRRHVYTFNFQLEAWSLEACTELCLSKSQPELVHILYEQKGYFWKHVLFWELPSSCCYWFTFQIGLTTLTRLLKREEPLTFFM